MKSFMCVILREVFPKKNFKKVGDVEHPCSSPLHVSKSLVRWHSILTVIFNFKQNISNKILRMTEKQIEKSKSQK